MVQAKSAAPGGAGAGRGRSPATRPGVRAALGEKPGLHLRGEIRYLLATSLDGNLSHHSHRLHLLPRWCVLIGNCSPQFLPPLLPQVTADDRRGTNGTHCTWYLDGVCSHQQLLTAAHHSFCHRSPPFASDESRGTNCTASTVCAHRQLLTTVFATAFAQLHQLYLVVVIDQLRQGMNRCAWCRWNSEPI